MKIYNKLVRDKIPTIIEASNKTCKVEILNDEQYIEELNKKLQEELKEYQVDNDIEELADIYEVILALCTIKGINWEQLEQIRKDKAEQRGRFDDKLFLVHVNETDYEN